MIVKRQRYSLNYHMVSMVTDLGKYYFSLQTSNNCPAVRGTNSCTPQLHLKSAAGSIVVHNTVTYSLMRFRDIPESKLTHIDKLLMQHYASRLVSATPLIAGCSEFQVKLFVTI